MGANKNKLFLTLNDSSVLEETLRKLISHPQICHIYLVYAQEDQEFLNSLSALPDLTLVLGGQRRQDSVAAALAQIQTDRLVENVIVHGALQHLLVLPNKNWTDRELAAYHAKQYLSKITERRARANLGAGRASMSVQMRPFV